MGDADANAEEKGEGGEEEEEGVAAVVTSFSRIFRRGPNATPEKRAPGPGEAVKLKRIGTETRL